MKSRDGQSEVKLIQKALLKLSTTYPFLAVAVSTVLLGRAQTTHYPSFCGFLIPQSHGERSCSA